MFYAIKILFKIINLLSNNKEKDKNVKESVEPKKNAVIKNGLPKNKENTSNSDSMKERLNIFNNSKTIIKTIPIFFITGFIATFLGIGGGMIKTMVFFEIFKFPLINSTASSTGLIFFNAIFNTIAYGIQGNIDWVLGITLGLSMMTGARIGAKISIKIPKKYILALIMTLLTIAGIEMIVG